MKSDNATIKESSIQGTGIFAAKDFKKGEIILKWDLTNTLSKEEVDKKSDEEKRHITFLNNKYTIMQSPEKFVNHSCNANTTAKNFCDIAIKDIKKGDEITGDYNENALPNSNYMTCNCKSKNCKKKIKC